MSGFQYVVGQWVRGEKFYGHAGTIEEVLNGPRNSIWLLGTRRIGKTSFLKQIELLAQQSKPSRYLPIFWDLQGSVEEKELAASFNDALLDADKRLAALGLSSRSFHSDDAAEGLAGLRRELESRGVQLLLLCDEAEELITLARKDPRVLLRLRRAFHSQEGVRVVLTSTIRLWELADQATDTSPFLHGFVPPVYLSRLAENEAEDLIAQRNLPPESRPKIDPATVTRIRAECGHHPYLMQLVCKRYFELGSVDQAIEAVASDEMVRHFFGIDFGMLTGVEQDALEILSASGAADSGAIRERLMEGDEEVRSGLYRLEQLGYIHRNPTGSFEIANHFFRHWLSTRRPAQMPVQRGPRSTHDMNLVHGGSVAAGSLLDRRYRLLHQAGDGTFGRVFKAVDELLRETIAVKILKQGMALDADAVNRFRQEIVLTRDLAHPNIVRNYHFGECQGTFYLTMKWLGGPTLAAILRERGALPIAQIVTIASKVTGALQAAHRQRLLHRDVKPSNIIFDEEGAPFLTDFGLARLVGAPGLTQQCMFIGTPHYASPEQGALKPLDHRSDLYSLGVVLFEMATGALPFASESAPEQLRMHQSSPPPDPRSLRPALPEPLTRTILRLLEKDPARRYPDADALLEDLGAIGATE
ncbi:MAG: serine/threonine protein kinase [Acidobacteria bacterium]|nr:serine/threonine protein kinase [Acidobacteriota bacterium]